MYKFIYLSLLTIVMIMRSTMLFAGQEKSLHIPIYDSRINLDPAKQQDTYSTWVSRQINCQLMRISEAYPILEAANSIEYITPWKIAITLKEGLTFSDGQPVTAYDVIASFHHLEKHQNYLSNITYWIKKMYAISDKKIIIELRNPASEFIEIIALNDLPIYPKKFLAKAEKQPKLWKFPVTCGGYKVVKNNIRELALSPRYNGYPIVFEKINSAFLKKTDYQKFDLIDGYFIDTKEDPVGFKKIQVFAPYQIFLGLNTKKTRWKNKEIRCKFLAQMHRDAVLTSYGGRAQKANDLFPTGVIGYREAYQFIKKIREQYLPRDEKIAFSDFCLAFLNVSIPKKYNASYIKMVRHAIDTKNFHTKQIINVKDYARLTQSNCDAIILGFQSNALEGYDFLVLFGKNGKNFTGLYNKEISEALLNSQNINDIEEKARQYQQIADAIRDQCVAMPLITIPMQTFFIKDSLKAPNIGKSSLESYYLGEIT